jgi:probable rRNA maturation factor
VKRKRSSPILLDNRAGKSLGISANAIRKVVRTALAAERAEGALSILVTRNAAIRRLNKKWRGKDQSTNVLSFPQLPPLLGDVVISADYCRMQGEETGSGFRYTFLYYLVHGVLHLLGHDHEKPAEARRMYALTEKILKRAGED